MKHIKTASAAEKSMREMYPTASEGPAVAEASHVAAIKRIVDLNRQIDLLKLEASKEMGALMGYMQKHEALTDANGTVLVTWSNASGKKNVDYDGILLEMNVPPAVVARHTTVSAGSRVFTVVAE